MTKIHKLTAASLLLSGLLAAGSGLGDGRGGASDFLLTDAFAHSVCLAAVLFARWVHASWAHGIERSGGGFWQTS